MFLIAVLCVFIPFCGMLLIACTGLFNEVELEIGLQHYAEKTWLPFCSFMPLNTCINIAYIGLGLNWLAMAKASSEQGILKGRDTFLFYTFNLMSIVYGFVQLFRIVSQQLLWGVMDQWCTFPFFSLLLVWGLYYQHGWSTQRAGFIMLLSSFSYALSLCFSLGFELALGVHILGALYAARVAYVRHPAVGCLSSFYLALLSCIGFVVLKLLDHQLPNICFLFRFVSGHFLSKICDVYQIHFVNHFFFDLTLQKAADNSRVEQNKFFEHFEKNDYFQRSFSNDIMYEMVSRPINK
ncbi:transmembrane protein 187-like [Physella acuta]|uniref:transmembrane protein 187-like n=1 Tax=Physella acuta TaxID=109671 RepID=UPI0027DDBF5D|nr:transmembrane protein 187-like [Physella acuta]XP_059150481.1 transmembrane protein 187-like [Physella acuta]